MAQQVKAPASAAGYTPATQDPDLRSQINSILIRDGYISKIQDHLLHALHSHQSDWPTLVQNHALSLLRSGEVFTFPALLRRVLEDVRSDAASARPATYDDQSKHTASDLPGSLAIPQSVIDEAIKVTKESLAEIVSVQD